MAFTVLSFDNKEAWSKYLRKLPREQQDAYYTPEYYALYENLGDGKAQCFVFELGDQIAMYPFLLNSVNQLEYRLEEEYYDIQGAYGYNGVISSTSDEDFIEQFNKSFCNYCKEHNIIAEFTRFHPILKNHTFSQDQVNVFHDRETIMVDLQKPYDQIYSEIQKSTRKQIRRATTKYDLEIRVVEKPSLELSKEIYKVYVNSMGRLKATDYLYFNEDYFLNLLNNTNTSCLLAYHDEKLISVITCLVYKDYIHGHLGGTLSDYLKFSPFCVLYNTMIEYGQSKGCKFLHVGGGASKGPDDPVFVFKKHFSDIILPFYIGTKIHNQKIYNKVVVQWENMKLENNANENKMVLKYRT